MLTFHFDHQGSSEKDAASPDHREIWFFLGESHMQNPT